MNQTEVVEGEKVYVACNALLDGRSKITLILDTMATQHKLKILGVVDLLLSMGWSSRKSLSMKLF